MSEDDQQARDALRLLRLMVDQAVAEGKGQREEENLAGVTVAPAGVDLDAPRNSAAVEFLLQARAVERDDTAEQRLAPYMGDLQAFKILQNGLDYLREAGV